MSAKSKYSFHEAKVKAEAFCAYQERCVHEVRQKLLRWNLPDKEIDQIIEHLIEHSFLDEKRFAEAFVLGKFRIKRWGKHKISQKLAEKHIDPSLIKSSLDKIDEEKYLETLKELIQSKYRLLRNERNWENKVKVKRFLMSRGFEAELINRVLD